MGNISSDRRQLVILEVYASNRMQCPTVRLCTAKCVVSQHSTQGKFLAVCDSFPVSILADCLHCKHPVSHCIVPPLQSQLVIKKVVYQPPFAKMGCLPMF